MRRVSIPLAVLSAAIFLPHAQAQAIRTNAGFSSHSVPRNDDGSSGLEPLGFTINFFGKLRSAAYVNNNGNLTFDSALPSFTPFGLQNTSREIIAPFFADVDTRPDGSRLVTYGQDTVNGHKAFAANYVNVGYYNIHADKLNSFQVVLIDRSETGAGNFDIEFNYAAIKWETGDASGGVNGYGGTSAAVGWSNGTSDPTASYELPGSLVPGSFLDNGPRALVRTSLNGVVSGSGSSNVQPGRLMFRARDGQISPGLSISNGTVLPDATVGSNYSYTLTAAGEKGPFRWSWTPDVANPPGLTLSSSGVLSGVPATTGTYSFTLTVTATTEDGDLTASTRGSITIRPPALTITSVCPLDDAAVGRPYAFQFRASGASGLLWSATDPYSLPPGLSLGSNGQFAGTPVVEGTYQMTIAVGSSDPNDGSKPVTTLCRMNVNPTAVRLTSSCLLKATVSVPFSQILSSDGGYGPYRFDLVGNLPKGLAMTSAGLIAGTPMSAGAYQFGVAVTDQRGSVSTNDCWITIATPSFSLPEACPLPNAQTGQLYIATLTHGYTWSLASGALPTGLTMTPEGLVTGIPKVAGSAHFGLIATDSSGGQLGVPCTLAVERGELSISGCPLPHAQLGVPYRGSLTPIGGSAPYFFSISGHLPAGLDLLLDGTLTGTPSESGLFPFTAIVRESAGGTTSQSCSLTVDRPTLEIPLNACPLPDAHLGEPYSATIHAAGGQAPYRFQFAGFLPDGLKASADGTLSGTPASTGGRSFLIGVTDATGASANTGCSLNVAVPKVPAVSLADFAATYPAAATNVAVTVQLAEPYTQPIDGTVALLVEPDTRSLDAGANQADPRLRFASGLLTANFTLAAGATRITLPIASTGTVASTVTARITSLRIAGVELPVRPTPKMFSVAAAPPAVTSACYARTTDGIQITLAGLSTTRELKRAYVTVSDKEYQTDLTDLSAIYFSDPATVRFGGSFSLILPYTLNLAENTPVGTVTLSLANTVGQTAAATVSTCR